LAEVVIAGGGCAGASVRGEPGRRITRDRKVRPFGLVPGCSDSNFRRTLRAKESRCAEACASWERSCSPAWCMARFLASSEATVRWNMANAATSWS
jgi:hypothetical protein